MRAYAIAMTVHVLGIVALFGGFAILHRAGARLRAATRIEDARPWAELLATARAMVPSGVVMQLLSGGYLGARAGMWQSRAAWLEVSATTLILVGLVILLVALPRLGAAIRAVQEGSGPIPPAAAARIGDRAAWSALLAANGASLGIIWLMTAKPALLESLLVVLVPAAVGAVAGARLRSAAATPRG